MCQPRWVGWSRTVPAFLLPALIALPAPAQPATPPSVQEEPVPRETAEPAEPEAAKAPESEPESGPSPAASWDEKLAFESEDGRFRLELGSRVQFRFTYEDPEGGEDKGSFRVRRAKVKLEGHVYEHWDYKIQAAWSGGSTTLEDAEFQYTRNPLVQPWLGQGKVFFGRQELTSSGKQQFVDRSIASERFAPGRDQGVALVGEALDGRLEYQTGVYNGNGRNRSDNDDDSFLTTGRVVWMPLGAVKLAESSLELPAEPRLAIGGAVLDTTEATPAGEVDVQRLGAEMAFKLQGWNLVGEWYREEASGPGGGDLDTDGYYLQAGWLFPERRLEVAGRISGILPDTPGDEDETEVGAALSYYFDGHDTKLQADVRRLEDDATGLATDELRLQVQFAF